MLHKLHIDDSEIFIPNNKIQAKCLHHHAHFRIFPRCQIDPSGRRFRFQQIDKQFTRQSRFLIVWFRLRMLSDLLLEGRFTYRPTEDKIRTVCAKFDHFSGRNAIFVVVG